MIVDHKAAIIARLNTDTLLAQCGHEGVVPPDSSGKRPERYWTIFIDSGARFSDRLGGLPTQGLFRFWVHWCGRTPEQAQRLADRGIPLLAGWLPAVDGYAPHRVQHVESQALQLDSDVRPGTYFGVDRFSLATQPA